MGDYAAKSGISNLFTFVITNLVMFVQGAGDSDQDGVESSTDERQEEEVDIEEIDEVCHSASSEVRELDQDEEEEEDIEVNEDEEREEN